MTPTRTGDERTAEAFGALLGKHDLGVETLARALLARGALALAAQSATSHDEALRALAPEKVLASALYPGIDAMRRRAPPYPTITRRTVSLQNGTGRSPALSVSTSNSSYSCIIDGNQVA